MFFANPHHITPKPGIAGYGIFLDALGAPIPDGLQGELELPVTRHMRLVVIESPFGAPNKEGMETNAKYARACMKDSLDRGEAPYASHLLYTQMLDDTIKDERRMGMEAGFAWGAAAKLVAVYTDRGISRGMREGIMRAQARGASIEFRTLRVGDEK